MKAFNILVLCLLGLTLSKDLRFLQVNAEGEALKGLDKINWWVDSICGAYQGLVKIFSYSESKTLKDMWTQGGYKDLEIKGKLKVTQGVDELMWDQYIEIMKSQFQIPDEYQKYFKRLLEVDQIADDSKWLKTDLVFDPKNGGNYLKSFNFMFNHREIGEVDAIAFMMDVKYELSDIIMLYQYSKSYMGGVYTKVEDKLETRDAPLTNEHVQGILVICGILGYKYLAQQLGIELNLPEF